MGLSLALPSCAPPPPPNDLVARGERLFFEETFGGNGRTCGTCHLHREAVALVQYALELIASIPDGSDTYSDQIDEAIRTLEAARKELTG